MPPLGSDKNLPQITNIRNLLGRGIGVHHGGLLPIVKEVYLIPPRSDPRADWGYGRLLSCSLREDSSRCYLLLRLLPWYVAWLRLVVHGFSIFILVISRESTCPLNASSFRERESTMVDLSEICCRVNSRSPALFSLTCRLTTCSDDSTQMSGRAGRRGLDKTGTVIIVIGDNDPPDVRFAVPRLECQDADVLQPRPQSASLTHMLLGQPTKLSSQFRLTYSMILNLLRVEALRVEEMIKRSFSENASQRLLPEHQKKVTEVR